MPVQTVGNLSGLYLETAPHPNPLPVRTGRGRRASLPLPPHRTAPILQRRPYAARQAKAVDRGGAAERLEAVQLDAAPLEATLLQDVARGRVGDAGAGEQVIAGKLLEEIVDRRARGLGAKTLAPMR